MDNPFNLNDKVILITGASSGIGRQCCISCSKLGAKVVLIGRNNDRLLETLNLMTNSTNHVIINGDLNELPFIESISEIVKQHYNNINGIIHCAGISTTLPIKFNSPQKMQDFFETNVFSSYNLTRTVLKTGLFNKNGGSIVYISSVMSITGETGKSLYSMTKGAILSGAKSLAIELSKKRIRVNVISPGVVETPMSKSSIYSQDIESYEKIVALHPLGIGDVSDVANASIYLLSDASKWVTGTNLIIDGGYTAR